jgi:hypothetical protein
MLGTRSTALAGSHLRQSLGGPCTEHFYPKTNLIAGGLRCILGSSASDSVWVRADT